MAQVHVTGDASGFEANRLRLLRIAYRMLGTLDEAEDVVQETAARHLAADRGAIVDERAWLTTVTLNLARTRLASLRRERRQHAGPWLPEPVADERLGPLEIAESNEAFTIGMLAVLETLTPEQRAAFTIRTAFGTAYAELGALLGTSAASARQLVRRARVAIGAARPRAAADARQHAETIDRLRRALERGDAGALVALFTADAIMRIDGGGEVRAARRPIVGTDRLAIYWGSLLTRPEVQGASFELGTIGGEAVVLARLEGVLAGVLAVDVDAEGAARRLHGIVAPSKLARFDGSVTSGA